MLSEQFNLRARRSRWGDVVTMNLDLVTEWRDTVGPRDVVYHVGDLFHRCGKTKVLRLLRDLSGYWIFLVPGNHDTKMLTKLHRQGELPENVRLLPPEPVMLDVRVNGRMVFMHHYPPDRVPGFAELPSDAILLHGHQHGQHAQQQPHRALDVGWDRHERFLSLDDLCLHFREDNDGTATNP